MKKTRFSTFVVAAVGLLAMAITNVAGAFPTNGASCTLCHSDPGGLLDISPDPIEVQLSDSGLLTFSITSLAGFSTSAISVQGLENALLDASIGAGGDNWTHESHPSWGMSYVSDFIASTGPYTLDLIIGGSATPGDYPIVVMYVGDGGTGTESGFDLRVLSAGLTGDYNNNGVVDAADYTVWRDGLGTIYTQADYNVWKTHFGESAGSGSIAISSNAIPEPATLVMLVAGTLAALICRRPRVP